MRCYYELLGVTHDAGAAELKKAYYKQSLQWHPDKNQLDENSTSMFQEIQEAYRVLSDPQERAWYDSHRVEILQGGGRFNKGGSSTYEEERIDVFCFFKRSCFSGFDDTPKGFYSIYRKVFDDLTTEELRASSFGNRRSNSPSSSGDEQSQSGAHQKEQSSFRYPTFGRSDSSFSDVVAPFYQFWESFQTKKSYSWEEKYDTRQAESRPERRAMETENRRLRNAAQRKRNDEVRQLVAYVKKRDKRVDAEMERLKAANADLHLRSLNMARNARQREAERLAQAWAEEMASGGIAAHWEEVFQAELDRMESEIDGPALNNGVAGSEAGGDANGDDSDDEDEPRLDGVDELYCVACNKLYTSVKARENHESSKKHKKQTELLRRLLLAEEAAGGSPSSELEPTSKTDSSDESTSELPSANTKLTKRAKKALRKRKREEQKLVDHADGGGEKGLEGALAEATTCQRLTATEAAPVLSTAEEKQAPPANTSSAANVLCEGCGMTFTSRNQLFSHLKAAGHAKLKVVAPVSSIPKATARSSTSSKAKGRKK